MLPTETNIYFTTCTILKWINLLKYEEYKNIITSSFQYLVNKERVQISGFVIMPNHIHLIWKIGLNDHLKDVQRDFLKFTGQQIKFGLQKNQPKLLSRFHVQLKDREYQFWQRNSLSKVIYSTKFLEQKLDYIHDNPLQEKWQLSETPEGYKYSSASFYNLQKSSFAFLTHYKKLL